MLRLSQTIIDAMVVHALEEHPNEACGVLAGRFYDVESLRLIRLVNAAQSPFRYEVCPHELRELYQGLEARNESIVVAYHSHIGAPAYPSPTDIAMALEPAAHYVIIGLTKRNAAAQLRQLRSFRLISGAVYNEQIRSTTQTQADRC